MRATAVVCLLFLLVLPLAACGSGSSVPPDMQAPPDLVPPPPPTPAMFTALHYDVALDLATRVATSKVTLRIDGAGNCVTIGFRPTTYDPASSPPSFDGAPAQPGQTTVDTTAGTLTACRAGLSPWTAGAMTVLSVTATIDKSTLGLSQVGYSVKNDLAHNPFTYVLSWVDGCSHDGPCDSAPSRFATYTFHVTGPAGTQVFCPGAISTAGSTTTCDFTQAGGPTYSGYGLVAGSSWTPTALGNWAGVDVTLYDYPQSGIAAAFDRDIAGKHMQWLQGLLGPYPFGSSLRYVVGPTYWLGFEHPGNIVISQELVLQAGQLGWSNPLRHVAMHELTHQWAGDHATLAGTYDFFWKEAVSEYLTYVFEDEQVSAVDGRGTLDLWKSEAAVSNWYPVPGDQPAPPLFTYYTDAYGEGPYIAFRQLEVMFSRKAVTDALASLLSSSAAPRAISVDDLGAALAKTTGADLSGYWKAWVHGSGKPAWPTAKVTATDAGGGSWRVSVAVSTADGVPRGCDFHVRLHGAGAQQIDVPIKMGVQATPPADVMVQPGFAVQSTEVDPLDECLVFPSSGKWAPPRRGRPMWVTPGW